MGEIGVPAGWHSPESTFRLVQRIPPAEDHASRVVGDLTPYLDDGRDIIVIEPSDLAMLDRGYERFLPQSSYERLSTNACEIMEYVYGLDRKWR